MLWVCVALENGDRDQNVWKTDAFYLPALTEEARTDSAAERDKRTVVFILSLFSLFLFVRKELRCVC